MAEGESDEEQVLTESVRVQCVSEYLKTIRNMYVTGEIRQFGYIHLLFVL